MKLLVGIPYNGEDPPAKAAMKLVDDCGCKVDYDVRRNYGVDMARNRIAAHAAAGGYDWLLFVDSDVLLPHDALENLLEHDADVCMGWYLNRHGKKGERTCLFGIGPGWNYYEASKLRGKREEGTYTLRVKGGGMGCCLIRPSIFETLKFPWFEWRDIRWDTETGKVESCGEDIDFCKKLEAAGIPIYADTRVECEHLR